MTFASPYANAAAIALILLVIFYYLHRWNLKIKARRCRTVKFRQFDDGSILITGYNHKGEKILTTTPQEEDCVMKFGKMRVEIFRNQIIQIK